MALLEQIDKYKRLWAEGFTTRTLSRTIAESEPYTTEFEAISNYLDRISKITISERVVKIPGLTRWKNLILTVLAEVKSKEKRNVNVPFLATSDEITLYKIRPETFDLENFQISITSAGTVDIIPQASGSFDIESSIGDEAVVIITDFIELNPNPVITAITASDIDGEEYKHPFDTTLAFRASDLQIVEAPIPIIATRTLDIDGKADASGTSELVPIGVVICYGAHVPSLT